MTEHLSLRVRVRAMGIRDRPTSFRAPWLNGYVERLIGSIRRECTDHLIVFSEEHLRRRRRDSSKGIRPRGVAACACQEEPESLSK